MASTVRGLVSPQRGLLAVDQSPTRLSGFLRPIGVLPTPASRRALRTLLVTTPGLVEQVTAVLLPEEAVGEHVQDGRRVPDALRDAGLVYGVRVDRGIAPLGGTLPGATVGVGLDGLGERLAQYASDGAQFATWRTVVRFGAVGRGRAALRANAHVLSRFAALCQGTGLVPVLNVDAVPEGPRDSETPSVLLQLLLLEVFAEMDDFGVDPSGVVLRTRIPGWTSTDDCGAAVDALTVVVPSGLGGVMLASGGRWEVAEATLAALSNVPTPWPVTFAFGQALVEPTAQAWRGEPHRVPHGQRELLARLERATSLLSKRRVRVLTTAAGQHERGVREAGSRGPSATSSW